MPTRALRLIAAVALVALSFGSSTARAGDCPFFKIGHWGIGEIDDRFMFYLGRDRYLDTPIPSSPKWVVGYALCAGMLVAGSVMVAYRRRRNQPRLSRVGPMIFFGNDRPLARAVREMASVGRLSPRPKHPHPNLLPEYREKGPGAPPGLHIFTARRRGLGGTGRGTA
jgi:hypothetical protein